MSTSFFVKPKALTKHDQLRERLARLEGLIGQLGHGLGDEALAIPPLFDQITEGLAELQAAGQATPAETGQMEHASGELQRKGAIFLREIGGAEALRNARSAHQPDSSQWWWFLDQVIADKRRARLRRWLIGGGAAALALVLLIVIYQQFFASDPATMARYRHQQAAESLALAGNWADALGEVEEALAAAPNDPELLTLKGALQQTLGQREAAEKSFAAAEARFAGREEFLIARAQQFLNLNQNIAALADAQELIAAQADSAIGYLLLGQAYINLEDYTEAVAAFQQASELADSQGKPVLAASARVQLAMAMQLMSPPATANP